MKRLLTWTATLVGISIASTFAIRAIQAGRRKVKGALGQAEAVADRTRAALEETQTALRSAREAI